MSADWPLIAMNELDAIVKAWRALPTGETGAVLATVVNVRGSAYRRPGARMLMMADGSRVGSISGGCLESDVAKKARWLTENLKPVLRTYDTTSEDDAIWEFGLGCNGVVEVLLERVDSPSAIETLNFIDQHRSARQPCLIATGLRGESTGERLFVSSDGRVDGSLRQSSDLMRQCSDAFSNRRSALLKEDQREIFIEWVGPPLPLIIFGAGHDALPLASIAKELGWHVTVADGRPAYAKASRFPTADRVILLPAENPASAVEITADSLVVLMTHNYSQDREILGKVLRTKPRYLGLLGPKARSERMVKELGEDFTQELHAPIGLDIGADTPEAIALSIVAEIQAVISGRPGSMLRFRPGPIYEGSHIMSSEAPALPAARAM